MLSARIGRADGYFYGPYRTECRSQHRLAEAAEVLAASAKPCDPAIVTAFGHRLEMPGLTLPSSKVPYKGSSPKLR